MNNEYKLPPLLGTKKRRRYARKLSFTMIDPAGVFRVFGGQNEHIVKILPNKNGTAFSYNCDDCKHPQCSHELALIEHFEPHLVNRSAQIKKMRDKKR
jgi:hypothetical protein